MITLTIGNSWKPAGDSWKKDLEISKAIQFYIQEDQEIPTWLTESFSYIYDPDTDEVEFSFYVKTERYYIRTTEDDFTYWKEIDQPEDLEEVISIGNSNTLPAVSGYSDGDIIELGVSSLSFSIYYTANERRLATYKAVDVEINNYFTSTALIRIPAYGRNIREIYEDNKSSQGLISPEDYNPTLGSNFYKDSGENSYITKDTYEDFLRSSNTEGHILDSVGRKQFQAAEGYYKIIKTLVIKCNELERTVNSDGNYYSADRSITNYRVYGIYTYDLYDINQNLIGENITEVTPHIVLFDTTNNKRVTPQKPPYLGNLEVPDPTVYTSYNNTYVGQLFYEDFDGILQFVQSSNHITLERFIAVELEHSDDNPVYKENDYNLYIIGPNRGDFISFIVQVEGRKVVEQELVNGEVVEITKTVYPEGDYVKSTFYNRQYSEYFRLDCEYNSENGKMKVKVIAKEQNNDSDPFRPSYAKILPILEKTTFKICKTVHGGMLISKTMTIPYYVIQKSSKIGIIPKRYSSKESKTPIDLDRNEDGKYLLQISEGIGVKLAYLGITSEVDPYDKDIVRSWSIREDMSYIDEAGKTKIRDREYFFESYTGAFEEKIVFISGAYDGQLSEFYIRDYIDRSDIWRRALYESEVTIIPIIDNIDKTVDLGGGWSYTLDTETNYFIGTNLLYLFNESNRYYTQRFNLEFTSPEHTGPDYSNFKASINNFSLLGNTPEVPEFDEEEGVTYTYYSNPTKIYKLLFGGEETSHDLRDREKDSGDNPPKIEVKEDDNYITSVQKEGKFIPLTLANTECPASDPNGDPLVDYGSAGPRTLYLKVVEEAANINTDWVAVPTNGMTYATPHYVHVTTDDTGYPAIDPATKIQKVNDDGEPLFIPLTTSTTSGWVAIDESGELVTEEGTGRQLYVDVTSTQTAYPTISGNRYYLDLTTEETGYPAFDSTEKRIRNTSNYPMSLVLTTESSGGWATEDSMGHQLEDEYENPLYVHVTTTDTGYPAYAITRHKYVDKYQSVVEIKNTARKRIFFCFEDIIDRRIVKFDIIYPQDYDISTKDIVRIPTTNPLKFVFRLVATSAVYEMQEIRFYCGIEGIQPIKLISDSNKLYPEPGIDYVGYPEIELEGKSTEEVGISRNKFNVLSETYSDAFPDWKLISAYNTFNYSAPNGNKIVTVSDNNGLTFEDTNSYLQIDSDNDKGGKDFIDFIRVREGLTNWWDDWRFFIYNKFTNRFSLFCSTGSHEFKITDGNSETINNITFDKIGLYRLKITAVVDDSNPHFEKLTITQTSKKFKNNLFIASFSDYWTDAHNANDPSRPKQGKLSSKVYLEPNEPYSINTNNPNGTTGTSFVLYLGYEGCTSKEQVKTGEARLEFEYTVTLGNGGTVTYIKNVPILQTPQNGNYNITNVDNFFELLSYHGSSQNVSQTYGDRRFSIKDSVFGIPIFGGSPGKIALCYGGSYPYKLNLTIGNNESGVILEHTDSYEIDSPLALSSDVIEESGCYIKNSFVKCTHEFKPDTYGRSGDDISNLPEKYWDLGFIDGRGETKHSLLYYYPPINYRLLKMISLGSRNNSKAISGRDSDNFIINAGQGQGNNVDPNNDNTFYYGYTDKNQLLTYPDLSTLSRLVINSESPLELDLLNSARVGGTNNSEGSLDTLRTAPGNLSGDTLYLVEGDNRYAAIKWAQEGDNSIRLYFYNDSDSGSTNIPLKLLSLFSGITDSDINKGWITTAKIKLNLKVNPPRGMSEDDFHLMMISLSDSSYPTSSQWFGLGQSFVNKIDVSTNEIQPSSFNGMSLNPRFTIPLGWFDANANHTIKIDISSGNPDSTAESLVYEAEIRKKPIGNTVNGDLIATVTPTYTRSSLTLSFSAQLSTDVVVIPKFTNIEYDCFKDFIGFGSTTGPRPSTTRKLQVMGINGSASSTSSNIAVSPLNGVNTADIPKTNSDSFIGFKITDYHQGKQYLTESGRLDNSSEFSTCFMQTLKGYSVDFDFTIDGSTQQNSNVPLIRLGYGHAIFIQPGYFCRKPFTSADFNVGTDIYINWYSFRRANNTIEKSTYVVSYDEDPREVFILYPRSDGKTLRIGLNRGGRSLSADTNPNNGQFFIQEMTIPIYEMGYTNIYTYKGQQENDEFTILGDFNNDIDSWIHPMNCDPHEYYRLVIRKGYKFNPGNSGGNNTGSGPEDIVDPPRGVPLRAAQGGNTGSGWGTGWGPSDSLHQGANIMGPYPSRLFSGNSVHSSEIKRGSTLLYKLIFVD